MKNLIAVVLLLGCGAVNAAPLVWTLDGITFDDGGAASGQFTYDADTNTYSAISITTWAWIDGGGRDGPPMPPIWDAVMTYADGDVTSSGADRLSFSAPNIGERYYLSRFSLDFQDALTNGGGVVSLDTSSEDLIVDDRVLVHRAGNVGSVSTVPIPASVWLFGSALAGLGWMRRRSQA
jgi:hypothetical protein